MAKHLILRGILSIFLIMFLIFFILVFSVFNFLDKANINKIIDEKIGPLADEQLDELFNERIDENTIAEGYQNSLTECQTKEYVILGGDGGLDSDGGIAIPCVDIVGRNIDNFKGLLKNKIKENGLASFKEQINLTYDKFNYLTYALAILGTFSLVLIILIIFLSGDMPFLNLGIVFIIAGLPFIAVLLIFPILTGYLDSLINSNLPSEVSSMTNEIEYLKSSLFDIIESFKNKLVLSYIFLFFVGIFLIVFWFFYKRNSHFNSNNK